MRMKIILWTLACMAWSYTSMAQTNWNMALLSNVPYTEGCNDIWGYVDDEGTEYAILGTRQATAILSLADPAQPEEIAYIPGSFSTWRDMKTWGHFAYVTADAGNDGLLIIDMSGLPDTVTWRYWKPELTVNGTTAIMQRCHNIYIDENGYAYLSGCSPLNSGGVIIFDVHSTPGFPNLVGHVEPVYSHDNYTRGDTVYSANLSAGFYITDVTDKEDPITLATRQTSFNFTHNVWLSDDGNYLFTTDERPNAFLDAYDISDHANIFMTDRFQPTDTRLTGVIPHNTHYYQGYNVVSWYTDGVIVVDSHKPDNLVQVANFDTYLGTQQGFQGCWGAYPYLPSGRLLASDINTCLWVFDVNYSRASYLEGTVIDAVTKAPLQGATIVIAGGQPNEETSGPDGSFKTGSNQSGLLMVHAERTGYQPANLEVDLTSGEVTEIVIEMLPFQTTTVSGLVQEAATGMPVANAHVLYQSVGDDAIFFDTLSNVVGEYAFDDIFLGAYNLTGGAWGYAYQTQSVNLLGPATQTVELEKAYWDEFLFDYDWTVSGNASRGHWQWGVPEETQLGGLPVNPAPALDNGWSRSCYATGLLAGSSAGDHDLDDGKSALLSPGMHLMDYQDPMVRFHYWFVNTGGNGVPNDTLKVWLIGNGTEVQVRAYTGSTHAWVEDSILVSDYLQEWDTLCVRFDAEDQIGSGNIVECGLDGFRVTEEGVVSTEQPSSVAGGFRIFPNPSRDGFQVAVPEGMDGERIPFQLRDAAGRLVREGQLTSGQWLGQDLGPGMYFLHLDVHPQAVTLPLVKTGRD